MPYFLDFEQPLSDLERQIGELRRLSTGNGVDLTKEANRLDRKLEEMRKDIYSRLTPWQKTQIARHPERPYTLDYVRRMMEGFHELHGDRLFADDPAITAGFARISGRAVAVIGHQKGRDTRSRIRRNFGQAHPEGYRKALRVMKMAEKFGRPILTLIDTPGAYPGIGAEERGQAEAIARNLFEMARIRVPILSVVIGEGGSGGALALGVGDRIFMLEHSVYSVISPEGCAAILWKKDKSDLSAEDYARAASALKLTAEDLKRLGVIDGIIQEPTGGMHNARDEDFIRIRQLLMDALSEVDTLSPDDLCSKRIDRLYGIGKSVGG